VLKAKNFLILAVSVDNPEEKGPYFEGDILDPPTDELSKAGIIGEKYRWTNAVVPYRIDAEFGK